MPFAHLRASADCAVLTVKLLYCRGSRMRKMMCTFFESVRVSYVVTDVRRAPSTSFNVAENWRRVSVAFALHGRGYAESFALLVYYAARHMWQPVQAQVATLKRVESAKKVTKPTKKISVLTRSPKFARDIFPHS